MPYGPLSITCANEICGSDAEERAVVIGIMNSAGYAVNAWLPILTYPQTDSPRFKKGFTYSTIMYGVAQFGITGIVALLHRRDIRRKVGERRLVEAVQAGHLDDTIAEVYVK